jgi:hypothetical protein
MNIEKIQRTSLNLVPTFLATATLITSFITPAFARNRVQIVGGEYGGNGCPAGTASVTVSPDGQELSILFDQFIAYGNNARESRKSCNLTIPIEVPQGFQISFYDVDYRGYVSPRTTGRLRAEYFFAGQGGPVFSRTFRGETDYNVRDQLATRAHVWSACGDSVNMRVNAAIVASGQGMATVDSFDLAHRGLVYHIQYRKCR